MVGDMMKHILLLGATGTFGTALTQRLIQEKKYKLTLFSRHATDIYKNSENINVIDGDALSENDLSKAIQGVDIVYCAISGDVLPEIAKKLISAMIDNMISRLIFMGAVGIYNEIPDEIDGEDNLDNEPAQIPNREAVDIVENSSLNYTILRPGYLREGAENDFVLTVKGEPAKGYITSIPSLVNFAIQLIQDDTMYSRESVSITKNAKE